MIGSESAAPKAPTRQQPSAHPHHQSCCYEMTADSTMNRPEVLAAIFVFVGSLIVALAYAVVSFAKKRNFTNIKPMERLSTDKVFSPESQTFGSDALQYDEPAKQETRSTSPLALPTLFSPYK